MKKYKKQSKGFTLIELLVVIAIIAVLSSVVLVNLNNSRTRARDANRVSDIKQLQNALELYRNTFKKYPLNLQDLVTSGYIAKQPIDPRGNDGNSACRKAVANITAGYCYAYNPSQTKYHLGAQLEQMTAWATSDSQFNSGSASYTNYFDGTYGGSQNYIYDIHFF